MEEERGRDSIGNAGNTFHPHGAIRTKEFFELHAEKIFAHQRNIGIICQFLSCFLVEKWVNLEAYDLTCPQRQTPSQRSPSHTDFNN